MRGVKIFFRGPTASTPRCRIGVGSDPVVVSYSRTRFTYLLLPVYLSLMHAGDRAR